MSLKKMQVASSLEVCGGGGIHASLCSSVAVSLFTAPSYTSIIAKLYVTLSHGAGDNYTHAQIVDTELFLSTLTKSPGMRLAMPILQCA